MHISSLLTDAAVLEELGQRLRQIRLSRNLTQEQMAGEAGITPPTVNKLEHGKPVQLLTLIRVMRVLGMLDELDVAIPAAAPSPVDQLRRRRRARQRASSPRHPPEHAPVAWRWGDEQGGER